MKKMLFIMIVGATTFLATSTASAHKVIRYDWECVGCGGACLDDVVVVTPEK